LLALNECGSHASVAASSGVPGRRTALLTGIIGAFTQDMLVIADRNFYSFDLCARRARRHRS